MQIRHATIADLDSLVALFDSYRAFYGQPPNEDLARSFLLDRFRHLQSVILMALHEEDPVGFAQLYPTFSSLSAAKVLILNDLFVSPEARGKGVGKALLAAAADYGQAVRAVRLTLSTATDNLAAQALYEDAGWVRETAFYSYDLPLK